MGSRVIGLLGLLVMGASLAGCQDSGSMQESERIEGKLKDAIEANKVEPDNSGSRKAPTIDSTNKPEGEKPSGEPKKGPQ